jgi:hypothetical protein
LDKQRTMKKMPADISSYDVLIGIDPGTNTGIALKKCGIFQMVDTMTVVEAVLIVHWIKEECSKKGLSLLVRVEDARLRTFFGKTGPEKWKGAGSVMRDCAIWEAELARLEIDFQLVHPKNVKATTAEAFAKITGWKGRTSIHAREAGWLII